MYKSGININTIKEVLGHVRIDTTEIYTHLHYKDVMKAIQEHPLSKFKIVITLDNERVNLLNRIFWKMNEISFTTEEYEESTADDTSNVQTTLTKVKLHIIIKGKSANEMADICNFNKEQRIQLLELTNDKYASMWSTVIYGSSVGSNDIVTVATSQIGNVGGELYWRWYGFNSRVEWCARFVSWCTKQCGYIDAGIIPKFASCQSEVVDWFKTCGLWKERGFNPQAEDIIFFDWKDKKTGIRNGQADHVGIVEKTENGIVYTIE